jgi:uncharacterized radical SAM protein YgiQ
MYIPTTADEVRKLGWDHLDVVMVSGDSYIDSPYIGAAVIGKVLINAGFKVGIIAQPDTSAGEDISRLGEPTLFWGVSAGSLDSMVANRTASGKKRKSDDYTPGGINNRRPDRASIVYTNLIKQHFRNTCPVVLGGIEASLRRVAHYDFWTDRIRRSILFDAKADYLIYGMAEKPVLEFAETLKSGGDTSLINGLCYVSKSVPPGSIELPSYQESAADKDVFTRMFHLFYGNNDPKTASRLVQKQDTRYLVHNPPAPVLSTMELDSVFDLDFEREAHPFYRKEGEIKALETIRDSLTTHRGCYGECNFCAITVHQGRTVSWRSEKSVVREAEKIAGSPGFKGIIHDAGGATANMYGIECGKKIREGACSDRRCLVPEICEKMDVNHSRQISLLRALRGIRGVKRVIVASGIRYDLVLADKKFGLEYLRELLKYHISGQMKIAPEHTDNRVLKIMGKPGSEMLYKFRELYYRLTRNINRDQHLGYYIIAAHPGCTDQDMLNVKSASREKLGTNLRQVQIFTPTPSTYSSLMYWTEKNPFTGETMFVEKSFKGREKQKKSVTGG